MKAGGLDVAGLILAGGQSRRMGRDKALLPLAGRPMIGHVVAGLTPQASPIAINANGDATRFAAFGLPVLSDDEPDTGPLGGVLAGLRWIEAIEPRPDALLTVPVDSPFLPADLAIRLAAAASGGGTIVVAASGERDHPVVALWPTGLGDRLAAWRRSARSHGVRAFLAACGFTVVRFDIPAAAPDPFLNVNTPQDLAEAERWLAQLSRL